MGNRLVITLRNKTTKDFISVGYLHWEADNEQYWRSRIKRIAKTLPRDERFAFDVFYKSFKVDANYRPTLILQDADLFNNNKPICCDKSKDFYAKHQDTPIEGSRCDGLISLDEPIADYWEQWAENYITINV